MTLSLDLSKVSPTCRDKVLNAVENILSESTCVIYRDLLHNSYIPESNTTKEMMAWRDGATELRNQLLDYREKLREDEELNAT